MDRTRSTRAQRLGDAAEQLVADLIRGQGWSILARNLRVGRDELDVLAVDPGPPRTLVVLEVRWRRRRDFGLAEETLDHRKRAALRRAVGSLLAAGRLPDGTPLPPLQVRIDLVAIDRGPAGGLSLRHHRGIRP